MLDREVEVPEEALIVCEGRPSQPKAKRLRNCCNWASAVRVALAVTGGVLKGTLHGSRWVSMDVHYQLHPPSTYPALPKLPAQLQSQWGSGTMAFRGAFLRLLACCLF